MTTSHDRHDASYTLDDELADRHPLGAPVEDWAAEAERVDALAREVAREERRPLLLAAAPGGSAPKGKVVRPPFVKFVVPTHGSMTPRHLALHTTEGSGTVESLAAYFRGPESARQGGLGVQYIVEQNGRLGSLGSFSAKTYHVGPANSICLGVEQIGTYRTSNHDWFAKYQRQLRSTVWIAAWVSQQLEIPLRQSAVAGRWVYPSGVCEHKDVPGNDHLDCGPGYPLGWVIETASKWRRDGVPLWVRLQTPKP